MTKHVLSVFADDFVFLEGPRWRFSREELIEHMRTDEPQDRIRYDRRSARSAN